MKVLSLFVAVSYKLYVNFWMYYLNVGISLFELTVLFIYLCRSPQLNEKRDFEETSSLLRLALYNECPGGRCVC